MSEIKYGKKRFDTSKNIETSGHISSYGIPPVSKPSSLPQLDPLPSPPKPEIPQKLSKEIQVELSEDSEKNESLNETSEEILKIKQEIQKKEEEIEEIKKYLKTVLGGNKEPFERIEKTKWDKQVEAEKKNINKNLLEEQILDKTRARALQDAEKEKDKDERLKQLAQFRNDEIMKRQEAINKANKYREELNVQYGLQKQIYEIEQKLYWENIPRPRELPPPPSVLPVGVSPIKASPSRLFFFSKKQPKKLLFNAITGELKDFSLFEQKSFSHIKPRNLSPPERSHFQYFGDKIVNRRMSPV